MDPRALPPLCGPLPPFQAHGPYAVPLTEPWIGMELPIGEGCGVAHAGLSGVIAVSLTASRS